MAEIRTSLAAKLIEVVGSEAIRKICSIWGYKSELDDLKDTITTIRKVLLDAASKDQLTHEAQHYIWKLEDTVYDADDLFDEFRTLAELKQHNKDGKLSEKEVNMSGHGLAGHWMAVWGFDGAWRFSEIVIRAGLHAGRRCCWDEVSSVWGRALGNLYYSSPVLIASFQVSI